MKFSTLFAALFVAIFAVSTVSSAANNPFCFVCGADIQIPKTWVTLQALILFAGCGKLGDAAKACTNLIEATDLTASYPNMYPFMVELRQIACDKYCK